MTIIFTNKHDKLDGIYTVSTDGFVNMPFIGKIKAEGLSTLDLKAVLEKEYVRQGIYKSQQIQIELFDKPPTDHPYLKDVRVFDRTNYFKDKQGDFFSPKDLVP